MKYQILTWNSIKLCLILSISATSAMAQDDSPIGWASQNGGTTGGQGGDTTIVTSRHELLSVIGSSDPRVILIKDTVALNLYERLIVGPNKSIIGMATGGTLLGGGLEVKGDNVIIQNLRITGSYEETPILPALDNQPIMGNDFGVGPVFQLNFVADMALILMEEEVPHI